MALMAMRFLNLLLAGGAHRQRICGVRRVPPGLGHQRGGELRSRTLPAVSAL
jgi:hypothetical protein